MSDLRFSKLVNVLYETMLPLWWRKTSIKAGVENTFCPGVLHSYLIRGGQGFQILKLAGLKVLLRVSDSVVLQGISTSIPQTVALLQLDAFQILLEVFLRGLPCSSYINVLLRHIGRHSSDRQFPPPTRCSSCPSTSPWLPKSSRHPFLRWLQYSFN